jgi:hypothetical protein
MTHITNRQQLLEWLEDNAPSSTLRAVRDGQVELLGLFDPIPSSSNPGWILVVTSAITKRIWNVVVSMQNVKPFYYTWMIEEVPWKNWIGYQTDNPLHLGDHPGRF